VLSPSISIIRYVTSERNQEETPPQSFLHCCVLCCCCSHSTQVDFETCSHSHSLATAFSMAPLSDPSGVMSQRDDYPPLGHDFSTSRMDDRTTYVKLVTLSHSRSTALAVRATALQPPPLFKMVDCSADRLVCTV
jgi:hypothetical protein